MEILCYFRATILKCIEFSWFFPMFSTTSPVVHAIGFSLKAA